MKKTKKMLGAAVAAVIGLCGVTTVLAAPAQAAGHSVYYASNDNGSLAIFKSYGELICAKDTKANGHGALAMTEAYRSGEWQRVQSAYEGRGNGHTTCRDGGPGNIAEGLRIRFRACLLDGPERLGGPPPFSCGPWTYGTA